MCCHVLTLCLLNDFRTTTGIVYAIKYATDIVKIVAKPLSALVIAVGLARVLWFNRRTLWTFMDI